MYYFLRLEGEVAGIFGEKRKMNDVWKSFTKPWDESDGKMRCRKHKKSEQRLSSDGLCSSEPHHQLGFGVISEQDEKPVTGRRNAIGAEDMKRCAFSCLLPLKRVDMYVIAAPKLSCGWTNRIFVPKSTCWTHVVLNIQYSQLSCLFLDNFFFVLFFATTDDE